MNPLPTTISTPTDNLRYGRSTGTQSSLIASPELDYARLSSWDSWDHWWREIGERIENWLGCVYEARGPPFEAFGPLSMREGQVVMSMQELEALGVKSRWVERA
jgi:hypothetical protein